MSHQCVSCGKIYPVASKELLEGCNKCGGHFFFYVKEELLQRITENPIILPEPEKKQIEKDIREMAGVPNEEIPVILDIESVRVVSQGKYEIDLVNVFNKNRPLVYKIEEGKYIIDLASTFNQEKRLDNKEEKKDKL